ncbi:MAG TPA: single-stranded DNA-binding protein, partial [Balneola sp.]|nr:single-stranded DNA-binding protein [Balneola sp.]
RFLPAPDKEDLPWAKLYSHAFQGKGGWFIENSRTTLGENDPVSEANNELWNSGIESDKDIARQRKRKMQYISNILVISDPATPENEGKVFL